MQTIQFKTNIKCSGCIATVTPVLNKTVGENNWEVNLLSPEKLLTVTAEQVNVPALKQAMENVGYKAEELAK
jgi:copper chaperone